VSDVAAISYGSFPVHARSQSLASANTLNLQATLGWGAAAIATIMLFAGVLEGWRAATGAGLVLPFNLGLFVQPLLGLAVVALIVAAVQRSGLLVAEYLGLARPRLRDVLRGFGWGVLAWFAVIAIMLSIAGITYWLGKTTGQSNSFPTSGQIAEVGHLPFLISLWILLLVVAPVAEEILFRGFLYRGLVGPLGAASTIVLTSVVFGLLHKYGFGWDRVTAITVLGLLLGWLRYRTGGTTVPMICHATVNFIQACILTVGVLVMP
jgi:membrane protease YdiL (CAAX protease family)